MNHTIQNCRFCGMSHGSRCPSIKAIEYHEDGITVRRVEFMTPADYPGANLPQFQMPINQPLMPGYWNQNQNPNRVL